MGQRRKRGPSRTIVVIVQDKSGSMHDKTDATISGFNEYKNTLRREAKGQVLLTLTQFDTRVNRVHSAVPISEVPDLNPTSYVTGGMTALYDAVGRATRDTERAARKTDRVLVVIMTDGGENSSKEWTHAGILRLFEDKRRDDWEFVFLGAGEEAWATGQSLGFDWGNSINYRSTPYAVQQSYSALASSTADYAGGMSMSRSMTTNSLKAKLETDAGTSPTFVPNQSAGATTNILWTPTGPVPAAPPKEDEAKK